jgi:putative MATE family efflux protein
MTLIMSFEVLISLTDVYIAGKVGKDVQAAYGFVAQVYFVLIVVANAFAAGAVSVVSRLFTSTAANSRTSLADAIHSSLVTTILLGLFLSGTGWLLAPVVVDAANIPEQLKPFVRSFIHVYTVGLLFHYLLINGNAILRSCDRVRESLRTMAVVCVVNIPLNFFFVFHTPLGYRGIALATASSVFIGSLLNYWQVKRLVPDGRNFSPAIVKTILQIGWPMGVLQILWQLSSMVLFLILSALPEHNVEILAAFTTGLRIESAIYLPAFAFNMANAVIVGNLLGSEQKEEAFRSGIITAAIGVAIVMLLTLVIIFSARWILPMLSGNEIVIRESITYIYISMISEPFMAWGMILGGGMNGAGDTKGVMFQIALSVWLVRIPLCFLLVVVLGFGASSVWWSMNASQFVQALLLSRRYFRKRWLQ